MNLEQLIKKQTFPRLLALFAAVSVASALLSYFAIDRSLEQKHRLSLNNLAGNLEQRLSSLRAEVQNLSANDFIINALIDYQVREEHLPVFFRSLRLSAGDTANIVFADFEGKQITSNGPSISDVAITSEDWKQQVLENGEAFFEISSAGILMIHPVYYSDLPEGALLVQIPDLQSALSGIQLGLADEIDFILLDTQGTVLYASSPSHYTETSDLDRLLVASGFTQELKVNEFRLISTEDFWSAYRDLSWLVFFVFLSLATVFGATFFSIRLATRTATTPLLHLQQALDLNIGQNRELKTRDSDVSEVAELKHSYNTLINQLDEASRSLNEFEGIFNSLNDFLLVTDLDFKHLIANKRFLDFAVQVETSGTDNTITLVPEELLRASETSEHIEKSYWPLQVDGKEQKPRIVDWIRYDYTTAEGRCLGYVFVGNDVTENRTMRTELEIKNKAIDAAYTSVVISEYTQGMPISYVNPAFTTLTGYTQEESIGRNCKFLQGPGTDAESIDKVRQAIADGQTLNIILLNYKKDGTEFYNELSLSPIKDNAGKITHILGLQSDVSSAERTKAYLAEAKAKAEESASLKSNFLASMSHEIRTPMNGVLGMLHLLESSELNKEQKHHAALAKTSADHLLTIIDDILDFSKIEAGKLDVEYIEFDAFQEFSDLIESMSQRAAERGNALTLDMSACDMRTLCCDPGRLRQIGINLIGNAIKFTENGEILVKVEIERDSTGASSLVCTISDTGIGIPADRLDRVFETFTQADNSTTRQFGGTGLGLSICRQLCELMGGQIEVRSEAGHGSEFTFKVRLRRVKSEALTFVPPDWSGVDVALIDAHVSSNKVAINYLTRWGACCRESSPQEVLEAAGEQNEKLVFLDAHYPDVNTIALCKEIISRSKGKQQVVIMKDLLHSGANEDYLAAGASLVFPKPITPIDLINVSNACLTNSNTEALTTSNSVDSSKNAGSQDNRELTVLLAEDNPVNQLLAKTLLENLGLKVVIANHGLEALEMLKTESATPFKAVFMDCQMPHMDGYETTACIRLGEAGEEHRRIPIIAMTANALKGDKEKCLDSGMDDYISKPIDPESLGRKLEQWVFS